MLSLRFWQTNFVVEEFVVKFWHIYTHIWKILSLPCVYSRDTFSVYFIFLFFITLFMQNMLAHYYKLTSHTHVSTNVPSNLSFGEFVVICKYTFRKYSNNKDEVWNILAWYSVETSINFTKLYLNFFKLRACHLFCWSFKLIEFKMIGYAP